MVATHRDYVFVTGDDPESRATRIGVSKDRRVAPQPREPVVGDTVDERVEVVEVDLCRVDVADVDVGHEPFPVLNTPKLAAYGVPSRGLERCQDGQDGSGIEVLLESDQQSVPRLDDHTHGEVEALAAM